MCGSCWRKRRRSSVRRDAADGRGDCAVAALAIVARVRDWPACAPLRRAAEGAAGAESSGDRAGFGDLRRHAQLAIHARAVRRARRDRSLAGSEGGAGMRYLRQVQLPQCWCVHAGQVAPAGDVGDRARRRRRRARLAALAQAATSARASVLHARDLDGPRCTADQRLPARRGRRGLRPAGDDSTSESCPISRSCSTATPCAKRLAQIDSLPRDESHECRVSSRRYYDRTKLSRIRHRCDARDSGRRHREDRRACSSATASR